MCAAGLEQSHPDDGVFMLKRQTGTLSIALILLFVASGCTNQSPPIPETHLELGHANSCTDVHGKFIRTGNLLTPRVDHNAILLHDGRVLLVGGIGHDSWQSLDSAELYDPTSGSFRGVGNMISARSEPTLTTLKDGRVLVAGGWTASPNAIEVRGGMSVHAVNAVYETEIFDAKTESFSTGPVMSSSSAGNSAVLLDDGRVLIIGDTFALQMIAEIYDPAQAKIIEAAKPLVRRYGGVATVKLGDGRVLVTCSDITAQGTSAEVYDPRTNAFAETGRMLNPMSKCSATLLPNGEALVLGYADSKGYEGQLYDPSTNRFREIGVRNLAAPIPSAFNGSKVLITSADLQVQNLDAYVYDSASDKLATIGEMPTERFGYSSTALADDSVLIAGGASQPPDFVGGVPRPTMHFPVEAVRYCP
jgi:Kelch motif